jgi:hypothetical protein
MGFVYSQPNDMHAGIQKGDGYFHACQKRQAQPRGLGCGWCNACYLIVVGKRP